jgi:hypothetical protein
LKGIQHAFPHLKFALPKVPEETPKQLQARARLMLALDDPYWFRHQFQEAGHEYA